MKIHDQVFLITGGARGLGAATAIRIAQQGGYVLAADLNLAQAIIENCLMNGATVRLDGAVRLAAQ